MKTATDDDQIRSTRASDITVADILALRDEAGEAGDEAQVEQCNLALAGCTGAWSNCVDVILAGQGDP